jgi:hypothetical protein
MRKWLFASLNAVCLILLQMLYLNSNWVAPVEEDIVELLTKIETNFFHPSKPADKVVFVNTAYATAITGYNEAGNNGTISITDRQKLAEFFSYLAEHGNQHRYVLCDVRFTNPSSSDSILNNSLSHLTKYVLPKHIDTATKKPLPCVTKDPQRLALADYVTYGSNFSKMMLYEKDHGASVPMKMFQEIPNTEEKPFTFSYTWFGLMNGLHSIPNSIFPRFYYTGKDLQQNEIDLNAVLSMINKNQNKEDADQLYNAIFKDRIIAIGNFNDDIQPTAIGFIPGTLLLLNSYLTLKHKYDLLSLWYLLFLFICFTLISYYVFHHTHLQARYTQSNYPRVIRYFFKRDRLFYVLVVVSIIGDLCFSIRSTILLLTLYFLLLEHGKNIFHFIKNFFV